MQKKSQLLGGVIQGCGESKVGLLVSPALMGFPVVGAREVGDLTGAKDGITVGTLVGLLVLGFVVVGETVGI